MGVVAVLSLGLLAAPAAAVPAPVTELYDPSIVRELRLEMLPLAGWQPPSVPTDCVVADPSASPSPSETLPPEPTESAAPSEAPAPTESAAPTEAPEPTASAEPSPAVASQEGYCWETMSPAERDAYVAADPQLRAMAVQAAWDTIRFDTTNTIILPAMFSEAGAASEPLKVGVRRKSSRALPSEADPRKIGMKVRFSEYVKGQLWRGVSQLSLENGGDVSPLHEGMAWRLHQAASVDGLYGAGYDPGLAAWATVSMNGEHLGVYTSVEQRNKQFLRNRSLWQSGSTWMYEQDDIGLPALDEGPDPLADGSVVHSPTYERLCFQPFRPLTGDGAATCPTPTDGLLDEELDATIRLQPFLTQAALDAFTANDDALLTKGKNYLFVDRVSDKRRYYPWDLDSVFRAPTSNIYSIGSTTNKRGAVTYVQSEWQQLILNHPVLRPRYNSTVLALLNGPLSAANVDALFAAVTPQLAPALDADPYFPAVASGTAADHIASLRAWITARDAEVRRQVAANVPAPRKADAVLPTVSAPALSATTAAPGATVSVTASVSDNAEIVTTEVRVGTGSWVPIAPVDGVLGGSAESLAGEIVAPATDGTYDVCVRAIDSSANIGSACTRLQVSTPKVATSLVYSGPLAVKVGTAVPLAATLTLASDGSPLAGRTVTFTFNKVVYTATTDANGVASVSAKAITKTGLYSVAATWAGAVGLSASSASATVTVTR